MFAVSDEEMRRNLVCLAKLVGPRDPITAAARLCDMLPLEDVPDECWSEQCMRGVARRLKGFPTYGQLIDGMIEWSKEQRQTRQAITVEAPDADGLDKDDRSWVAYYHKRVGQGFKEAPGQAAMSGGPEAHVLSLIKSYSPAAWSHITGKPRPDRFVPPTPEACRSVASLMRNWEREE